MTSILSSRCQPAVAPISDTKIIILGGDDHKPIGDAIIFDSETESFHKVTNDFGDFKFDAPGNNCQMVNQGTVCALVKDQNDNPTLIQYFETSNSIEIIHTYD